MQRIGEAVAVKDEKWLPSGDRYSRIEERVAEQEFVVHYSRAFGLDLDYFPNNREPHESALGSSN
jgi:hypothetical protein